MEFQNDLLNEMKDDLSIKEYISSNSLNTLLYLHPNVNSEGNVNSEIAKNAIRPTVKIQEQAIRPTVKFKKTQLDLQCRTTRVLFGEILALADSPSPLIQQPIEQKIINDHEMFKVNSFNPNKQDIYEYYGDLLFKYTGERRKKQDVIEEPKEEFKYINPYLKAV